MEMRSGWLGQLSQQTGANVHMENENAEISETAVPQPNQVISMPQPAAAPILEQIGELLLISVNILLSNYTDTALLIGVFWLNFTLRAWQPRSRLLQFSYQF